MAYIPASMSMRKYGNKLVVYQAIKRVRYDALYQYEYISGMLTRSGRICNNSWHPGDNHTLTDPDASRIIDFWLSDN